MFLRSSKVLPGQHNVDSVVRSLRENMEALERIARDLEGRFSSALPASHRTRSSGTCDVTLLELAEVLLRLPAAAPGPDGITATILKVLFQKASQDLLRIVNTSLRNSWIPP